MLENIQWFTSVRLLWENSPSGLFSSRNPLWNSAGTDVHDALTLGEGGMNWVDIKPYLVQRDFIFEINLPNHEDCSAMMESQRYFVSL